MKHWARAIEAGTNLPESVLYLRTSIVTKRHKWNPSLAGIVQALQFIAAR